MELQRTKTQLRSYLDICSVNINFFKTFATIVAQLKKFVETASNFTEKLTDDKCCKKALSGRKQRKAI